MIVINHSREFKSGKYRVIHKSLWKPLQYSIITVPFVAMYLLYRVILIIVRVSGGTNQLPCIHSRLMIGNFFCLLGLRVLVRICKTLINVKYCEKYFIAKFSFDFSTLYKIIMNETKTTLIVLWLKGPENVFYILNAGMVLKLLMNA
jgi:hypothetical protein